ncbi:hypothetical protein [Bifidobacterium scardovii]|uniref:Uncharacterized protein n=1 Tax=Bifidobacterium scardovii TaxID=158787 RepID=A0A087D8X7_9BIFI|nr:hypothetical protein [Bifidobacterium scardovii]KFI91977.1 hypothetical protein BSCA_2421 [Bifidobacterium scardovii]MBS6947519.1 hypothetical protein [Bifidobacterium scardovii]MDK6349709.1 hypothetical protein [Bifidobacterium scardovii]MDU2422138.1 hypothetical protein [Bifidobacterium scardovii]MDU3736013.1 hypothetical protein [Bifidobacterium scardovii]
MTSTEITVLVIVVIASMAIGLFFGLLPLKVDRMTEAQNKYQQFVGIIGVGMVIVLIMAKQEIASWATIGVMIAGVLIAKIPAVHRWGLERFPFFEPKKPQSPLKRATSSKRPNGGKSRKSRKR